MSDNSIVPETPLPSEREPEREEELLSIHSQLHERAGDPALSPRTHDRVERAISLQKGA
jgi:hypothetical protein